MVPQVISPCSEDHQSTANLVWQYVTDVKSDIPASIATLAQHWPNVNPYVGPTSAHQRWANVDLSIGPTVARQRWPNVVPTSAQRWRTNVGPTLNQWLYANVVPTLAQRRLRYWLFVRGTHRSPMDSLTKDQERWCWWLPKPMVEQTVELSNRWFETPMWSTSM